MFPHENLNSLFTPRRIAVIGTPANSTDTGNRVLANIAGSGFPGDVHVVGVSCAEAKNRFLAAAIADIPGPLDLALVCLPALEVPAVLEELAKLPTRAAVIYSAGFRGITGPSAGEMEISVKKLARDHGIAILGAKSTGFFRAASRLNATDSPVRPKAGGIGFFSQSGSLASAVLDWASAKDIGFSSFASLGNKSGLDESDILGHLAEDPATTVIVGCLENIESGRRFMENAHRATRKKPVILLRAGTTHAGSCAMSAHSGARAGENLAYTAALRQTGIIPAERLEDLFHLAQAFTGRPLPKGPNTVILANGGGLGIVAADACEKAGLGIAKLSLQSMESLRSFLPPYSSLTGPVDLLPDADAARILKSAEVLLEDPNAHSLLVVLSPTREGVLEETAKALAERAAGFDKPVFACFMGGNAAREAREILSGCAIPHFEFPYPAVDALAAAYRFSVWQDRPLPVEISYRHDLSRARKIMNEAREAGFAELSGAQAQALLAAFEMPLPTTQLARTSDEAAAAARQTGYPVRILLDAPGLPPERKNTFSRGAVKDEAALKAAFLDLTNRAARLYPEIPIRGCLVQALPAGFTRAVAINFRRDPVFGPLLFLCPRSDLGGGLGGEEGCREEPSICRIAPLSLDDAHDLARSLQGPAFKTGVSPASSQTAQDDGAYTELEDILLIMSELAMDMPEITEAACGPIFFSENQALVTDAHFFLSSGVHHMSNTEDK